MALELIGNIKGPKGDSAGFGAASAQVVAPGSPAEVTVAGPDTAKSFHFKIPQGPQGIPGLDAMPQNEGAAAWLTGLDANAFKTAVNDRIKAQLPMVNVLDHGVVGNNVASDQVAFEAAVAKAKEKKRTLWVPTGLVGVRLTAPVDARYIDVLFESPIRIAHTAGPGITLGDSATAGIQRSLTWRVIRNTVASPSTPSVRIVGLKAGEVHAGNTDYLELFADAAVPADGSIAYSSFFLSGAFVDRFEFLGVNGSAWINDNKFFGGRLKLLRFSGTYPHNGNKFFGPTIESSTLIFDVGSDNHLYDVRSEGACTATFAADTWGNLVRTTYTATRSVMDSNITVTDAGVGNIVTSTIRDHLEAVEVFRLDRFSRIFDAAGEYRHGGGTPVPGLRHLKVRTQNQNVIDTGILPIEQVPAATAVPGESFGRLDRFVLASSHNLWRPFVYCYDANMQLLDPTAAEYITGGWLANAANGYYWFGSTVPFARLIVRRPEVKYLRFRVSSSSPAGTPFEWLSLTAYTRKPFNDSLAELWRRAVAQPLFQAAKPTQGVASAGERVAGVTGDHVCVARVDTALSSAAAAAATSVDVASITGIAAGDLIGVLLTDGATHWTTVSGAPASGAVGLAVALPGAASSGAAVVTNRWVAAAY